MTKDTSLPLKAPSSKNLFLLLLVVCLCGAIRCAYLWTNTLITKRLIVAEQKTVDQLQKDIAAFSDIPGFDKLKLVKQMENTYAQMPRSDHIQEVREIFNAILNVDTTDTANIVLSDFKISLEEVSLRGYVSNLRILYQSPASAPHTSLIERFEKLKFLSNITIKKYEKAEDNIGYNFVLTAKVTNNDTK
jgi:hypothetical protein